MIYRIRMQCVLSIVMVFISKIGFSQGYNLPPEPELKGELHRTSVVVDSLTRNYDFYIPPDLPETAPLLLIFHGMNSDTEWTRAQLNYKFDTLADENGLVVVYPNGIEKSWNGCIKDSQNPARQKNVDDVAFTKSLIQKFQKEYNIDTTKVLAMGLSNGGYLCLRLASEIPNNICAFASILSVLPTPESNLNPTLDIPVPYMFMVGTEDPFIPYEGGFLELPGAFQANFMSAVETIHMFRDLAGYSNQPQKYLFPDLNPDDQSMVEEWSWNDGTKPEILLYIVHGGGHCWPIQYEEFEIPAIFGNVNRDHISTGELVWKFFQRQIAHASYVGDYSNYK